MSATLDSVFTQTLQIYLKPVLEHLEDPGVSEVLINGPDGYTGKAAKAERSRYKAAKVAETAQENTHK